MASNQYQDEDSITGINVTPFVDVVLVLLVIFMVTAKMIVSRGVVIDKPKAAAGGAVTSKLELTVEKDGTIRINGEPITDDASAVAKVRELVKTLDSPKAIITGDRATAYAGVMRAINVAWRAGVTAIALTNDPDNAAQSASPAAP